MSLMHILIRHLEMRACIGVHEWELERLQPVVLDVDIATQACTACVSDQLDDTIDYAAVVERLQAVAVRRHALVEAMAHSMCETILADRRIVSVRLTLLKLAPFPGAQVGVTLERTQQQHQQSQHREQLHVA